MLSIFCGDRARATVRILGFGLLSGVLFLSPAGAGPVEGSLRVTKTSTTVRLTWEPLEGPYGVFASPRADDVQRPAWMETATQQTSFEEPLGAGRGPIRFYLVADPIFCNENSECDNLQVCDGAESCNLGDRLCRPGAPVVCNDGSVCTDDACDESTGTCLFSQVDCEDGVSCTVDRCDPELGCYAAVDPLAGVGTPAALAGRPLGAFPHFEFPLVFNQGETIQVGVDPNAHPEVAGQTCDIYIVIHRTPAQWCANAQLADVRGTPDRRTFPGGSIVNNTFPLTNSALLSGAAGTTVGAGYDIALDCNRNGFLDPGELADGLEDRAGVYVAANLTLPGPLEVTQFDDLGPEPEHCDGGGLDDMRIYHPSLLADPGFTGTFPLVVISHGNGHCFDWYDFLGRHLASYGYIAMSHDNDTMPGIETASTTTLLFTDKILQNQETLGGGVLLGHIDARRIAWIGHSRGGEGVARAYDRLVDEAYPTQNYKAADIRVISSIAPTDFLGTNRSNPQRAPYHLLYGSADGDVCGCPDNSIAQSFGLFERALGVRQSTYVHGADHNDFNCCGFEDFSGPADTRIGRPEAQQVQKVVTLALLKYYLDQNPAAKDFLWRQWETFLPLGVNPATVVVNDLRELPARRSFVLDSYQSQPDLGIASSGGAVTATVDNLAESRLRETNGSFNWTGSEPMNGMTRGRSSDFARGSVFDFSSGEEAYYELEVLADKRDFRDDTLLSFRAAQMTRHPLTTATLADLTFTVTLVDGLGRESSINIGTYGGGIEEPYQRTGYGSGAGWQNEFETIRIRLADFLRDGAALDLGDIRAVRFEFGAAFGSAEGRVGLDNIELVKE